MEKKVELKVDKTVTRLAGYPLGKKIYEEQVKGCIDLSESFILVFPSNIKKLASSFIQGMFGELVEKIGISGIERQITIESVNPEMKKNILDILV